MASEHDRRTARLIEQAADTARQMQQVVGSADPARKIDMPASAFTIIATLLEQLVAHAEDHNAQIARQAGALRRITDLRIRGATELFERGDWKKIAAELQAIAQDGLALERNARRDVSVAG